MKNRLREKLEAMLELHTGDSITADNVHSLVNGIFSADGRGGFEYVEYDEIAFPQPQTIGDTASSIEGLGSANEKMIHTIFVMPNDGTNPTATMMIVVDEKDPSTDPKTYQYVYVGDINNLPSDVLTEGSIVDDLTTGGTDKSLSAEQGRILNSHVNYTTCGSGAGDQVKLISDTGFELSTNLRLLVKMSNTNTHATPKFNINNTGIKDVWYNGAVASDTNTWADGEVLDVYYDGTEYIANTHGGAQFSTGEKVGDVGIDNEPTAGSDNLIKSSGVYSDTHLCNIPGVNDFMVDIVLKDGVEIDFSRYNRVIINDLYLYGEVYYVTCRLEDSSNTYDDLTLFTKHYSTKSEAESLFGVLLESDYCYLVVRHVSDGRRTINSTLIFNRGISWDGVNEHPIIKELLIANDIEAIRSDINDIEADINDIKGNLLPITLSGTKTGWQHIWVDANNPIPQDSLIENLSEMPILAYDSISEESGEYTYYTIPVGKSWSVEFPVYRMKTQGAGDYLVNIYYPGSLSVKLKETIEAVNTGLASMSGKIDSVTNTLYGGSEELLTVVEQVSGSGTPPRTDGTRKKSGWYKNYTVDLTGAFARGFTKVRFYAFSYTATKDITQGLVATGVENGVWIVESFITPVANEAGYCELPITADSKLLVACLLTEAGKSQHGSVYDESVDLDYVPATVQLLNEESTGIVVKVNELDSRVTALEEGGGGGTVTVKFPATYLQKKVYGVIGDKLQIFRRSVVVSVDPYKQYLDFICGQGKVYERYLEITPEKVNGAVPINLTIIHRLIADDFSKSEEQISNLVLADRPSSSPASNINVLCIGASTTASGQWPSELKRRLTSTRGTGTPEADGLSNITFVGRKELSAGISRPVAVKVEATGGWTWSSFYTPKAAVRFTVSGVTGVDVGTVYSYTNSNSQIVKVSVAEVNITEGSGNIRCVYTSDTVGRGLPSSTSGIITRVSTEGGDGTISYSAAEEENYCPFYDEQTEQPDFQEYSEMYCNGQIDVMIAYMGNVNEGIRGDTADSVIATKVNNMKVLLDAFHADFPNGKVIVGVAACPSPWYGYEEDYTAASANKTWSLRYGLYRYAKAIETFLQGNDYKNWCFLANTHTEMDSENCYPTSTKAVNTRMPETTEKIGINGAHPMLEGYQMVADSFYRCFVNTIL